MQGIYARIREEDPEIFSLFHTSPPLREDIEYKLYQQDGKQLKVELRTQKRIVEIAREMRGFHGPNHGTCDLNKALSENNGNWHIDGAHLSEEAEKIWAYLLIDKLKAGITES
jgi:hypothetical protein